MVRFHLDPVVRDAWRVGETKVAQQAAFQVPEPTRIAWARSLALAALPGLAARPELVSIMESVAALHPETAARAYVLFQDVRTLRLRLSDSEETEDALLALAELACKVTDDAARPGAPFDADSDVRLVQAAAGVARRLPELEDALWNAVCRRPRGHDLTRRHM